MAPDVTPDDRERVGPPRAGAVDAADLVPDIGTRVVSVFMHYFDLKYGRDRGDRALERIGGPSREYLADPENFVSLEYCVRLATVLTEEAGDPDFLRQAGLEQLSNPSYLGFIYYLMRSLGSPSLYYRVAVRTAPIFNRVGEMSVEELGPTRARFRYRSKKPEGTRLLCVGRIGQLAAAPTLWGMPPAKARELACQQDGDDACVYEFEWVAPVRPLLWALLGGVLGATVSAAAAVLGLPIGLADVAVSTAAGVLVGLCLAYRRSERRARQLALDATEWSARSLDGLRARFEEVQRLHATADAAHRSLLEETQRRAQAESALIEAQKLEAIGRLSSSIAHDFNNLLTIIMSYADLVKDRSRTPLQVAAGIDAILLATARAADLTRKLLSFARKNPISPRVLALESHLDAMGGMLSRLVGEDVRVEFMLAEPPSYVRLDPGQLEQLILNLAANARDAMPQGGVLRLETRRVEGAAAPGRVELLVSDTGVGMDAAIKQRVFEPFFTTKAVGKGTGLGLLSVREIVQQSAGEVDVWSEPGKGSTFRCSFPCSDEAPSAHHAVAAARASGGTETVLLVEDDDALRGVVQAALASVGYHVLAAGNGAEALVVSAATAGPIDLLITDVVMRGGDGYELSERLRTLRPGLAVLFVSGYPDDVIERHGLRARDIRLVRKPFAPPTLEREVRAVLDETAARRRQRVPA